MLWRAATGADDYVLEEALSTSFANAQTVYAGPLLSWMVPTPGKTPGTYYYRVKARNATGESGWSNAQAVTVYPMFVGLQATWDGRGYIRGTEYGDVGNHATLSCDGLTDPDTIRCNWRAWYNPNPYGWPEDAWTRYYSVSTGDYNSGTNPGDPSWKWGDPWRMPYGSQFTNGQTVSISGQSFRVSGPLWGYTAFGVHIQYWELVNLDRFLMWDGGGDWKQYVHAGEAKLRYQVGGAFLRIYSDVLRRDYYRGTLQGDTVQYITNLTSTSAISGTAVATGVILTQSPDRENPRRIPGDEKSSDQSIFPSRNHEYGAQR